MIEAAGDPDLDAVAALADWLSARPEAAIDAPLFVRLDRGGKPMEASVSRSTTRLRDEGVTLIVKEAVASIGLDPGTFLSASLRAGNAQGRR
ncbi:hypothetical protein [Azospirillum griseum]|uniref:Uncharacterized protein n=1 Tax=Azospirillum griseum TaxID=2496639 RepID=A0A431V9T1_9PROT|nr:hypothetical protein [Azospirillum griseum]RTR12734.1 hypothetical protein EJ903_25275 [Azospirillum griseum]